MVMSARPFHAMAELWEVDFIEWAGRESEGCLRNIILRGLVLCWLAIIRSGFTCGYVWIAFVHCEAPSVRVKNAFAWEFIPTEERLQS